jgi:hypothetical protein
LARRGIGKKANGFWIFAKIKVLEQWASDILEFYEDPHLNQRLRDNEEIFPNLINATPTAEEALSYLGTEILSHQWWFRIWVVQEASVS